MDDLDVTLFDDTEEDNELFESYEESSCMDIEEKEDNKERTTHLHKINDLIDMVNMFAKTRNDFSKNVDEICRLMNELQDEIYSDDSWLRLAELSKINMLLDDSLDYLWKMIYDQNREKHEKINIDKDRDIGGYVSKYTDIVNDKLELVNRIGELLDGIMVEVQNVVDMVRETDNDSLICDILAKYLKKWKYAILELINGVNECAKLDTKKKDKPDTKKKDTKPDTKKKDTKLDINVKDAKPDTRPDIKPDTKKKDTKPDTKLDIEKQRHFKEYDSGIRILLNISGHLLNLLEYTSRSDNSDSFYDLCEKNHVKIADNEAERILGMIHSVNVVLDCIRDALKCKTWPKCISYNRITKLNKDSVKDYYDKQVLHKSELIL